MSKWVNRDRVQPAAGPANVCSVSDRYRNYEPLKATRRANFGKSAPQRKGAITSLTSQRAYLRPQSRMARTIGPRSRPFAVRTYSARGGLIE